MPEYLYKCEACGRSFNKVMGIREHETKRVACPKCSSKKVRQKLTQFSAITSKKS